MIIVCNGHCVLAGNAFRFLFTYSFVVAAVIVSLSFKQMVYHVDMRNMRNACNLLAHWLADKHV